VSLDFATKKTVGCENWFWGLSIIGIFGTIVFAMFVIGAIIVAYSNPVSSPLQLVHLIGFKKTNIYFFVYAN
jgi:hypothetical protein